MGIGRIRLETRALFEVRRSLVVASDPFEQISVIDMGLGVVGLKTQRRLHMWDCSIEFGLRSQRFSEVHMRFRVIGVETECDVILFFRLLQLAFFLQRQPVIKMLASAGWHIGYHPCARLNFGDRSTHLPEPVGDSPQAKDRSPLYPL